MNSLGYKILTSSKSNIPVSSIISPVHPPLIVRCIKKKILSSPNDLSLFRCLHVPPDNPNKVRKQACSLIAFKQLFLDSNECAMESTSHQNAISQLLNYLCKKHKVAMVKKFGNVYIGCIGFFDQDKDWGCAEENATHMIEFACDLFNLGSKYNIYFISAVDYGRVVGGYMEDIFSFDMFGPEILWVLSVCESVTARKIIVSKSVHALFTKAKLPFPFALDEWNLHLPGRKEFEKVAVIKTVDQYEIFANSDSAVNTMPFELDNSSIDSPVLPWYIIQQMLSSSKLEEYLIGPTSLSDKKSNTNYLQFLTRFITKPIPYQQTPNILKRFPDIEFHSDGTPPRLYLTDCKNNFFSLPEDTNEAEIMFGKLQRIVLWSLLSNIGTFPYYAISRIKNIFLLPYTPDVPPKCDKIQNSKNPRVTYNETILFDAFHPPFSEEWKSCVEGISHFQLSLSQFLSTHLSSYYISCWNQYLSRLFVIEANASVHSDFASSRVPTHSDFAGSRVPSQVVSQAIKSTVVETSHADSESEDTTPLTRVFHTPPSVTWNSFKNRSHFANYIYSDFLIYTVYSILCYSSLAHLYPLIHDSHLTLQNIGVYPLALAVALVLWSSVVFMDKNQPPIIYVILIGLKIFTTCVFPLNSHTAIQTLLSVFVLWNYFSLNQEILFYTCENFLTIAVILYRDSMVDHSKIDVASPDIIIAFQLFFFLYYVVAEFYTYICFLVQHTLIPYEIKVCQEEIGVCRVICGQFAPHIPLSIASQLFSPRRYRKCVILAFHIKAAESIPAVVDVDDVTSLIAFLYSFMDDCVRQFGLLSITSSDVHSLILEISHFSGVHISAICDDDLFRTLGTASETISYIQRAVICVRYMQARLKKFNSENSMNLTLGVSLSHGSATIGLLGNANNLQFDVSSRARDEAFYMCVRQTNSLVVSEAFYDEIHRLQEISNCVYNILDCKLPSTFLCQTWYNVELNSGDFGAIARVLEDYNYVAFLGEGGNGSVHLLVDKISKVQVAVKGIHWGMGRSTSINHIRRELRILQQLQHPNIVHFKFCLIRRAKIYIVMEYIRGGTLRQIIAQDEHSLDDLKIWFAQLVSALGYLHDNGIMHRDVKPSNCMIDTFGRLKLTDFGLALQEEDMNGTSTPVMNGKDTTRESDADSSLTTTLNSDTKVVFKFVYLI